MYGSHLIKAWSKTQAVIALSSGEAELYAAVKATAELLGTLSLVRDFGRDLAGSVLSDASATLSMIKRRGLGKARHVHTNYLWLQEKHTNKEVQFNKVPAPTTTPTCSRNRSPST